MSSAEHGRRKAYANDLRWRMVYQRIGIHLPLKEIAENLNMSTATAYRVNACFGQTGEVDPEDLCCTSKMRLTQGCIHG